MNKAAVRNRRAKGASRAGGGDILAALRADCPTLCALLGELRRLCPPEEVEDRWLGEDDLLLLGPNAPGGRPMSEDCLDDIRVVLESAPGRMSGGKIMAALAQRKLPWCQRSVEATLAEACRRGLLDGNRKLGGYCLPGEGTP